MVGGGAHPFYVWVAARAGERRMSLADLSRRADVSQAVFTRWKAGAGPSVDVVRRIAGALGVDFLHLLVVAGLLLPSDVSAHLVAPDVTELSDDELLRELNRRMAEPPTPEEPEEPPHRFKHSPTFLPGPP